ncbi:Hypothetical predicted protein [Marmota monax]|uniref:Uncharacterized protein n=1 Tax=Marmota monax TaxID=9995 RepID=A0A5E4A521_MARMO|nr:hypothetical protein GHT09_006207 [Marmota monax]VTJ52218.1 Hypothetical predicted protein [Marmota monax]
MAEVVSVSEPSPLEVFKPGLRELVFSEADEGWSGTGIAPAMQRTGRLRKLDMVTPTDIPIRRPQSTGGNEEAYTLQAEHGATVEEETVQLPFMSTPSKSAMAQHAFVFYL